jgi:dihydrofolate reductase
MDGAYFQAKFLAMPESRPLNLIVSCAENRVIGRGGKLPWSIPEDWHFFQAQTAGQIVILGRICYETWPGAVRDGRRAIVVSSVPLEVPAGVLTADSLPAAIALAGRMAGDLYICGGQRIYEEAIVWPGPIRLYITLVHAEVAGDRYFPEWRDRPWREVARRAGADRNWRYTFLTLEP